MRNFNKNIYNYKIESYTVMYIIRFHLNNTSEKLVHKNSCIKDICDTDLDFMYSVEHPYVYINFYFCTNPLYHLPMILTVEQYIVHGT